VKSFCVLKTSITQKKTTFKIYSNFKLSLTHY